MNPQPLGSLPAFGNSRDWFQKARYGLFIHWGLYAIPGWHEQHAYRLRVSRGEYGKLAGKWNPDRFDPDAWIDLAEAAGMKYLTFTTKHIDGFCLWHTQETDFHVGNTPDGRDILALLSAACHRRGMPLCLYYSIADMHHPAYPNQGRPYEHPGPEAGDRPDLSAYLAYVKAQVTELLTGYGPIHGFWWDARNFDAQSTGLNDLIRRLAPGAVINNRGFDPGDFATPEREWETGAHAEDAFVKPTEACTSLGYQSWGFRQNEDFYTDRFMQAKIDRSFTRGANFLLNVGPEERGVITGAYRSRLLRLGSWLRSVEEAFDASPVSPFLTDPGPGVTRKGNSLYLHLWKVPEVDALVLRPLDIAPKRAVLLNTGEPVAWRLEMLPWNHLDRKAWLSLARLPVKAMADEVMVIRLDFDHLPEHLVPADAGSVVA